MRGGVPVGHAGLLGVDRDRDRTRSPSDPVDELVPPRRGALRRVRDQLQGVAGVRLQALADRHDLPHERRAPLGRDADGVRDAGRRRCPHRRDDLPHVPRPVPARGDERDRADADRVGRVQGAGVRAARVLLRRPVRLAAHRLPLAARAPRRPRQARRLRRGVPGRARPVRLPAALAAGQRHALAQARPRRAGDVARRRRPADRAADARRGRPRRVSRGPRGDRLLGPLAVPGRGRDRPLPRVRRLRRAAGERRARDEERHRVDRALPELARRPGLRPRPGRPRRASSRGSSGRCSRWRASTS